MTFPCLDQLAVRIGVNGAISVDVIPEVSRGDSTLMGVDALEVRISDDPVAINIAREEAKRNITVRESVPVDVLCV